MPPGRAGGGPIRRDPLCNEDRPADRRQGWRCPRSALRPRHGLMPRSSDRRLPGLYCATVRKRCREVENMFGKPQRRGATQALAASPCSAEPASPQLSFLGWVVDVHCIPSATAEAALMDRKSRLLRPAPRQRFGASSVQGGHGACMGAQTWPRGCRRVSVFTTTRPMPGGL